MASRLITPVLEEILKSYPLYSQDGKGKDAVCVAIFFIGHVRWFVLEGQPEGNGYYTLPGPRHQRPRFF